MPDWLDPMAATLTQERFTAPGWTFERKIDGIRLLAFKDGEVVRMYSRTRKPQDIPGIAAAIAALPADNLILDGELTWDRASGFHIFDVLWFDARDLRELPLAERRAILDGLPLRTPLHRVRPLNGDAPWERACAEGWEGVIAKRLDSPYEHRRSKHWLKMKCELQHDFVVGGFTDPQGARVGLGALLVGYYEGDDFVFAGKVGTGFDTELLNTLRAQLDVDETPTTPFTRAKGLPRVREHWVKPQIVVRVAFIEWTVHEKLRHSRLLSIVTDRKPSDVVVRRAVTIAITHPDKVMFPDDGITKGELAAYYAMVATVMLPHLAGRPVTMERFHRGISQPGFFQKNVAKGPAWLERVAVPKNDGIVNYPVVTDERGLQWLANQNCITPHVWTSRVPHLNHPDICVFDLDPPDDVPREMLIQATLMLGEVLREFGCTPWVKTSGSKGFHIAIPLDGSSEWQVVARFAHNVGRKLVQRAPELFTQEFYKADRHGRILVDTGRNEVGQTYAATYAVRPKTGAPVSAPCTWREVESGEVGPQTLTLRAMATRLAAIGDLWADFHSNPSGLPEIS